MIKGLVLELRKAFPGKKLIISTVTPTGNKIAETLSLEGDLVTYLPLDLSFIVRRVIKKIRPCLFVIAETELWPNLIQVLHDQHIPMAVVNGRISDGSYKGYHLIKAFLRSTLRVVDLFCVQSQRDRERLIALGATADKVKVAGNMKFDLKIGAQDGPRGVLYRDKLGLSSKDKLLIAASTHFGEEEIILEIYFELLKQHKDLRLLIVPRHPERSDEVDKLVVKSGLKGLRISLISQRPAGLDYRPVFILDTVGELMQYYAIADIVFVGGSLVKTGGHNILEPGALGKPVLFGPQMFNFRDIADLFIENQAGIRVNNKEELLSAIRGLLDDPGKAAELGRRALELISCNQGATQRTLDLIKGIIR